MEDDNGGGDSAARLDGGIMRKKDGARRVDAAARYRTAAAAIQPSREKATWPSLCASGRHNFRERLLPPAALTQARGVEGRRKRKEESHSLMAKPFVCRIV